MRFLCLVGVKSEQDRYTTWQVTKDGIGIPIPSPLMQRARAKYYFAVYSDRERFHRP